MRKAAVVVTGILVFFLSTFTSPQAMNDIRFYDLANGRLLPENDFASRLADQRFVLVGERHNMASHHRGQLEVIKLLVDKGVAVAIGMEMMRSDSQAFLDAWVAGRLKEDEIKTIYLDNWNFPWELYRPIFIFARDHRIPIVGLNVPRAITRQVAREGFDSLSPAQREGLPFVTCRIDDDYMAYIREAYGAHGHGNMSFNNFCEAQLVWDKAMAAKALQYSQKEPDRLMVILAGTGHARKGGIPSQLIILGNRSFQVVLPEMPDILSPETLDSKDADFLIQGL
jgi:uncharacterized iron-regulated protein